MNILIQGVGVKFPTRVCSNEDAGRLAGGVWGNKPERIATTFGIETRHHMCCFTEAGYPDREVDELDLAYEACCIALEQARCPLEHIARVVVVSGTMARMVLGGEQQGLSKNAFRLVRRLGLSGATRVEERDRACAGLLFTLDDMVAQFSRLSGEQKILVVVSNGASALANRVLYTETKAIPALLVFGDAAGAFVLGQTKVKVGMLGFHGFCDTDPLHRLISFVPSEKAPQGPFAARIEGPAVMKHALPSMVRAVRGLEERYPEAIGADWYLVHQPHGALAKEFAGALGVDPKKVPLIVSETGNISGVFVPALLDRLQKEGQVKSGQRLVFVAIGDGVECGALLYQVP